MTQTNKLTLIEISLATIRILIIVTLTLLPLSWNTKHTIKCCCDLN